MTTTTPASFSARAGDLISPRDYGLSQASGTALKVISRSGDFYTLERTDGFFTSLGCDSDRFDLHADDLAWMHGGYEVVDRGAVEVFLPGSVCDDLLTESARASGMLDEIIARLDRLKNVTERGTYVKVRSVEQAREILGIADWVAERIETDYFDLTEMSVGDRSRLRAARRVVRELQRYIGE